VIEAGAANCAPSAGAVSATLGGAFSVTETGVDATLTPESSKTTAESE
jgi:hypothetical protein